MVVVLEGVVDIPVLCTTLQRNFNRLEKRVGRNFIKCDKGKCKVLYHRRNNPIHQYSLGTNQLEGRVPAKDTGVLLDMKLNMSPLCVP